MKISLVQTSKDRFEELKRFVNSLNAQKKINLEEIQLIFVDQGNNEIAFEQLNSSITFNYIKHKPCSLSCARNIALEYVRGEYISFPDDDCWYPDDLLCNILNELKNGTDGVTGIITNEHGVRYNNYPKGIRPLSRTSLCCASSICMFLKFSKCLTFDENIGVGSPFGIGSGEESDYLIRYIDLGKKVKYNEAVVVHHPINLLTRDDKYIQKSYSYAIGYGYLIKKNNLGLIFLLNAIARPLLGSIIFLLRGDTYMSKRSINILKGRFKGLSLSVIKS